MRKVTMITFVVICLLIFVAGVSAQEVPPERVDHESVITLIINTVSGLVIAAFGSAPITVVVVSLLKKISALDGIPGEHLTFATASVLFVGALIASVLQIQPQFEGLLELITVVGPVLVSFIGTLIAAPVTYHITKALDVPVIGQARSDEPRWK